MPPVNSNKEINFNESVALLLSTILVSFVISAYSQLAISAYAEYLYAIRLLFLWMPTCTVCAVMQMQSIFTKKHQITKSIANCLACCIAENLLAFLGLNLGNSMGHANTPYRFFDNLSGFYVFTAILPILIASFISINRVSMHQWRP